MNEWMMSVCDGWEQNRESRKVRDTITANTDTEEEIGRVKKLDMAKIIIVQHQTQHINYQCPVSTVKTKHFLLSTQKISYFTLFIIVQIQSYALGFR